MDVRIHNIETRGGSMSAANTVDIGTLALHFSYSTLVGVAYFQHSTGTRVYARSEDSYSRTTAGHMTRMGIRDWPKVSEQTLLNMVQDALIEQTVIKQLVAADPYIGE